MCLLKVFATDGEGNKTRIYGRSFNRGDVGTGKARAYRIIENEEDFKEGLNKLPAGAYTVTAEVTVANGEIFTPVSFAWNK